jgi:signal transduction histidine kinase/ActR/RegA family two-component response regulator
LALRLRPRGGAPFEAGLTVGVVRDRRGAPAALRWLVRPLTARGPAPAAEGPDAFDLAPAALGEADAAGRWRRANRRLCALLGRPQGELLGRPAADLLHPADREAAADWLRRAAAGPGVPPALEVRRLPGGAAARLTSAPLPDGSGCILAWEEEEPAGEPLASRLEEMAATDRRKDEFLAVLGHELRNHLAPLRNGLHLLRLQGAGAGPTGPALEMGERQVGLMARLVDDLLDTSRIRQGKVNLRPERVDVAAAAARAVEGVRTLVESRGHRLEIVAPPAPGYVEADPARLEQVLANLLNNAAKYTDPGGRITLTIESADGAVVVRVRDTGVGIAPEMLPRLFELFAQSPRSAGQAQGGLGIGLALVKRLVELHGGAVEAYSAGPGQGSEFVVRLPAAPSPPGASADGSAERAADRPVSVLVVEDNRDSADSLAVLLKLWGHSAAVAYDGAQALAAVRASAPEVVLMDIGLPGIDGCETARRLLTELGAAAPVLAAVTGYGREDERRRCAAAGFAHHFVKPVDPAELRRLLTRVAAEKVRHGSPDLP